MSYVGYSWFCIKQGYNADMLRVKKIITKIENSKYRKNKPYIFTQDGWILISGFKSYRSKNLVCLKTSKGPWAFMDKNAVIKNNKNEEISVMDIKVGDRLLEGVFVEGIKVKKRKRPISLLCPIDEHGNEIQNFIASKIYFK